MGKALLQSMRVIDGMSIVIQLFAILIVLQAGGYMYIEAGYPSDGVGIEMRRGFKKIGKQVMLPINNEDLKDG